MKTKEEIVKFQKL